RDGLGALFPNFDPATTRANPAGSGFVRDPLAGNSVPRSRMDPLSLRVLEHMPLPNVAPNNVFTNSNNFLGLASSPSDQGVTNIRIDHRFSDSDSVFGRYSVTRNTRRDKGFGLGAADPNARNDQRDNHNFILTGTHVFSPTLINEIKGNITRQNLPFLHPSFDQNWPEKLGYPRIIPQDQFPPIVITGLLGIGSDGFSGGKRAQHNVQLADSLTWVRGKHQIKFGVDQRWIRLNWVNRLNPSGRFNFSSGLTNDPQRPAGTGIGLATFLLGEVSGGQLGKRPFFSFHAWSHGSYVQDDFKITPRLTLNLGLRYDVASGPVERHNKHSNFDPFVVNPETRLPGVLTYAGATAPRTFVDRDYNNFGPRVGFAYDLTGDGKTALRGGYGLVYLLSESGDAQGDASNSLGFEVVTPFVAPTGGPFKAFQFSTGPSAILEPRGASGGPSAFRGLAVRYQDRHAPAPYLQQYNLTIQRQIAGAWVASASYAGSRGVKLFGANYNVNQMDPAHFALG
ncbi:MAG: TonB-dependent receptor domain-containing protein, partial [Bryobacteraceae bacterium]